MPCQPDFEAKPIVAPVEVETIKATRNPVEGENGIEMGEHIHPAVQEEETKKTPH